MSVKIDGDIGVIPIGNASGVAFTPVGGIAATNVQAALQEVDAEKLSLSGGTVTGQIKGITPVDAADLTRKDYVDGPVFVGTFGSSGIAAGDVPINLTTVQNIGVTKSGARLTPTRAGYYLCSGYMTHSVPSNTASGMKINYTSGIVSAQIQGPYSGQYSFASATGLVYLNGTTDWIEFVSYAAVAGGAINEARCSLVFIRP